MPNLDAIIFVPALAGCVVFGFVFLLFAAHYYLTVLQSAGSGAREVVWLNEPIVDHFWKVFYLALLLGLWFGPAYFLGRAATAGVPNTWVRLAVPLAVLWVCYPVSQLSSLGGPTVWLPLDPGTFGRLARKPGAVLGFYLLSAPVLAVFGVGFKWAFQTAGHPELLFAGVPLVVLSGLVYGALIGRLAFALRFTRPLFTGKKRKKRAANAAAPPPPPPETADEPLTGFDLRGDDEPVKPRTRVRAEVVSDEPAPKPPPAPKRAPRPGLEKARTWTDEDATAYGVGIPEVELAAVAPKEVVKPTESELRLYSREDAPKPPKVVWSPQVLGFLGQSSTWSVVGVLSGMCLVFGVVIRIARAFNPVAGAE